MIYIGIDPGKTGAWAAINHNNDFVKCGDMPLHENGRINARQLRIDMQDAIPRTDGAEIIIELVAARPGQGVTSMFSFGHSAGVIEAVASMMLYPVHFVTPQRWKKHCELIGAKKSASLDMARDIWPTAPLKLAKHHGRADALLLALYGFETLQ